MTEQGRELLDAGKHVVDVGAVGTLIATFFEWLPSATALVTFVWICIRLYETKTVQRMLGRKPRKSDERDAD